MTEHHTHQSGRKKNVCVSMVLVALGVPLSKFHYAQFLKDLVGVLRRNGFSVRSRRSQLPKLATMGNVRIWLRKNGEVGVRYLVVVPRHVLLLDHTGAVVVDTSPRQRDRRRVSSLYRITRIDHFSKVV